MAEKSHEKVFTGSDSNQIDCAVCLQPCVHPTVLPCGHIFCYLCVKGLGRTTKMCAMCRRAFPEDYVDHPSLLRPIESTPDTGFEDGQQWFYEGRNGGWWQYECRISEEIENAFKTDEKTVEIMICGELYVVDLNTMHQFQKNNPIRRRRIKRSRIVDIRAKGVAVLQLGRLEAYNNALGTSTLERQYRGTSCKRVPVEKFRQPRKLALIRWRARGQTLFSLCCKRKSRGITRQRMGVLEMIQRLFRSSPSDKHVYRVNQSRHLPPLGKVRKLANQKYEKRA